MQANKINSAQKKANIKSNSTNNDPRFNCRFTLSRDLAPLVLDVQEELNKILIRKPSIPMTLRYIIHQVCNLRQHTGNLKALMGLENLKDPAEHARARQRIPGLPVATRVNR